MAGAYPNTSRARGWGLVVPRTSVLFTDSQGAGTYTAREGATAPLATSNVNTAAAIQYIDPAIHGTISKLVATLSSNGTAWSTVTMTIGLHAVTASSGAADDIDVTVAAATAGTTTAFTDKAANAILTQTVDFPTPAAGTYLIGIVTSATITADNNTWVTTSLYSR